ncbi:MAG: sensor histidine kinase [Beutenbergiaceae bacterium]
MSQTPEPGIRIPAWLSDALAALIVLFTAVAMTRLLSFTQLPTPGAIMTMAITSLIPVPLMFARRRWPKTVLAISLACLAIGMAVTRSEFSTFIPVAFALYTVVLTNPRRVGFWVAAATAALVAGISLLSIDGLAGPAVVQSVLVIGITAAFGDAVRSRRAYTAELKLRAERAEQTREAEASRAVAEDRLRIARDLHDAVAHQISVISLNAGVANAAVDTDPSAAREALSTIRTASRTVLTDIGNLLATLRSPEDERRIPTVGAALLDQLLAEFADGGLRLDTEIDGDLATLSTAVDVVVYRVVQEGLTNALKHGRGARAQLRISVTPSQVRVELTNPAPDPSAAELASGHGLLGIKERVESVRGSVQTEHGSGTFRLVALIPLEGAT